MLTFLPCIDSDEIAATCRHDLDISYDKALELARSAVENTSRGYYYSPSGQRIDLGSLIESSCTGKVSIPPEVLLASCEAAVYPETRVQVTNETTLMASLRLSDSGLKPLALSFANGIQPGGGFLNGATAQEETLCRSSALYATLRDDPMYQAHRKGDQAASSDWTIYSPDVPFFRGDDGTELENPYLLSILTCAAPYAPAIGQPKAGDLLQDRTHRVLSIACAYGYSTLVLGAWGCGAFANDPHRTARDFKEALETEFNGAFSDIVFAISDWSQDRRFLGPFRAAFS